MNRESMVRCGGYVSWQFVFAVLLLASAASAAEQVRGLQARHGAGQTILTFMEVDPPVTQATISALQLRDLRRQMDQGRRVRYRVYRSDAPIVSLDGLEAIAEVPPLTCWNIDYYGDPRAEDLALRYSVVSGQPPVPPGTGICAYNPSRAGRAYYAVTRVVDGVEDSTLTPGNRLSEPVEETVGQGEPVLQRIERPERFQYVDRPTLHYYVRWESPPNCSVQGKPIDYVVGVPENLARPAPVGLHLHCWGGSLNGGYGWWYGAERGHLLVASNQIPYDWWTGYHERYWDGPAKQEAWEQGVVRPYTQRRLLSMLDWVATQWDVDLARTHVAGNSMGGSGAPMFAIRHPERIAWATSWVGVHIPHQSPTFASSYTNVYGRPDWNVAFEDGTPVWDYFNDAWYLRKHPQAEIGLICFSNGKNDGGIGWAQAVEFHRALQETRRPHLFVWGQRGHGQRAQLPVSLSDRYMPLDLRTDQSQPAFTRCSLDQDPGDGEPSSGDAEGQSNLYLFWDTEDVVDRAERWEMTVGLVAQAPKDTCTVDITPRRVQRFRPPPGSEVTWTNTSVADPADVQSGRATVDALGLITLPQVRIAKGKNRVVVGCE
jgi:pimeloyl-ACP methyl ester carboxylesterase